MEKLVVLCDSCLREIRFGRGTLKVQYSGKGTPGSLATVDLCHECMEQMCQNSVDRMSDFDRHVWADLLTSASPTESESE